MNSHHIKTKLLLGLEIYPFLYAKNEFVHQKGLSQEESQENYKSYLQRELANSSLRNLKPIDPGSWLFDINSIGVNELKVIIKDHLKDVDLSDYEGECGCLCGGVVIKQNDKTMLTSTCCADFSDLHNWEAIEGKLNEDWEQLWIGHPWVYYKNMGEEIGFSECADKTLEELKKIGVVFKIPQKELFVQLKSLRKDLIQFQKKVAATLKEMGFAEAEGIADVMVRN